MRVNVFDGWVELRDPERVPERLRRPVIAMSSKAITLPDLDDEAVATDAIGQAVSFYSDFNDVIAVAMIESWSWNAAVSVDALQDLPARTYDDIRKVVAPFVSKLMPDFSVDGANDPLAPTDNFVG